MIADTLKQKILYITIIGKHKQLLIFNAKNVLYLFKLRFTRENW